MKLTTRLSFLLLILILVVVMFASTQDATSMSTSVARTGEAGLRLKTYYDLSALPIKKAKASFRNASSNTKSDLWRTHLGFFLVRHPELNEQQKKIILTAMSLVSPDFFEMRSGDSGWKEKVREPLRSLEEQIRSAFPRNDAAKIFATLSDNTESPNGSTACGGSISLMGMNPNQLSDSSSDIQWINIGFGGQDKDKATDKDKGTNKDKGTDKVADREKQGGGSANPCECSTESDWCPITAYCSGTNCNPTKSGCGTLWAYPCNGASCR